VQTPSFSSGFESGAAGAQVSSVESSYGWVLQRCGGECQRLGSCCIFSFFDVFPISMFQYTSSSLDPSTAWLARHHQMTKVGELEVPDLNIVVDIHFPAKEFSVKGS
jgi:hypothetical protein